jgi:hypothetical protein
MYIVLLRLALLIGKLPDIREIIERVQETVQKCFQNMWIGSARNIFIENGLMCFVTSCYKVRNQRESKR